MRRRATSEVEADSGNDKKRTRVSQACNQCRRRKDRCDGRQPICRPCADAKRVCTYNPSKKRGLPTGYVRAVEMLMGLTLHCVPDSETMLLRVLGGNTANASSSRVNAPAVRSEGFAEIWRNSPVFKHFEMLLSQTESNDEDDHSASNIEEQLTRLLSDVNIILPTGPVEHNTTNNPMPNTGTLQIRSVEPLASRTLVSSLNESSLLLSTGNRESSVACRRLPSNWSHLLELYAATTHCWFPISQQHDLLRTAYTLADDSSRESTPSDTGEIAFLWAVFAYASFQSFDSSGQDHRHSTSKEGNKIEEYDRVCINLIPHDLSEFTIGHVRALLLLSLRRIGCGQWSTAWVLVGRAIYMASDLGILPIQPTDIEIQLTDSQKRVSLGCFVLETLIAARLNRRTYLERLDLKALGVLRTDGIEEWESWKPSNISGELRNSDAAEYQRPGRILSTFNSLISIVGIVNELTRLSPAALLENGRFEDIIGRVDVHQKSFSSNKLAKGRQRDPPQLLNLAFAAATVTATLYSKTSSIQGQAPLADDVIVHFQDLLRRQKTSACMNPFLEFYLQSIDNCLLQLDANNAQVAAWRRERVELPIAGSQIARPPQNSSMPQERSYNIAQHSNPIVRLSDAPEMAISSAGTLTGDLDEGGLFNSLAMLDSADWMVDAPQFMEHLGMDPGFEVSNFQALFDSQ